MWRKKRKIALKVEESVMQKGYGADLPQRPFPTNGHDQLKNFGKINGRFDQCWFGRLIRAVAWVGLGVAVFAAINLAAGRPWF